MIFILGRARSSGIAGTGIREAREPNTGLGLPLGPELLGFPTKNTNPGSSQGGNIRSRDEREATELG